MDHCKPRATIRMREPCVTAPFAFQVEPVFHESGRSIADAVRIHAHKHIDDILRDEPEHGGRTDVVDITVRQDQSDAIVQNLKTSRPILITAGYENHAPVTRHALTYCARCSPVIVDLAATKAAGAPSNTTRPPS